MISEYKIRHPYLVLILVIVFLSASVLLLTPASNGMEVNDVASRNVATNSVTGWSQGLNGEWYYYDEKGQCLTGWIMDNNKWYYLNPNGVMQTGWKKLSGHWYYLKSSGVMATGWLRWKGDWYYMKSSGSMQTGWVHWRGSWYYMDSSGKMCANQVIEYKDQKYYIKEDGILAEDCTVIIDGNLRYAEKGGAISYKEGWITSGKTVYLAGADGVLCTDRLVNYNGTYYYLRGNGAGEYLEDQAAAALAMDLNCDLKAAMNFAGMKILYGGKNDFDKSWGTTKLAEYGIKNRKGNCYVYAAVFRDLAYSMGYDAHQISGYVKMSSGAGRHSWVEIDIDGETYVFDPAGLYQQGMEHAYMFHYGDKGTWVYSDMERMN